MSAMPTFEPFKGRLQTIKDHSNGERFLNAYVSIEESLNRMERNVKYVPFAHLLKECAKKNLVVANNFENLKEYHELRNALVHLRGDKVQLIAEPCIAVTEDIERIAYLLQEDQCVLTYATKDLYIVHYNDHLDFVFRFMQKHHTSKLPVYEKDRFVGLLTSEAIVGWMWNHSLQDAQVKDVLKEDDCKRVVFVDAIASVQEVLRIFDEFMKSHKQAPFIIVTKNGAKEEEPIGILSSYDVIRIISMMF